LLNIIVNRFIQVLLLIIFVRSYNTETTSEGHDGINIGSFVPTSVNAGFLSRVTNTCTTTPPETLKDLVLNKEKMQLGLQ